MLNSLCTDLTNEKKCLTNKKKTWISIDEHRHFCMEGHTCIKLPYNCAYPWYCRIENIDVNIVVSSFN